MVDVTLVGSIGEAAGTRRTQVKAGNIKELLEILNSRYGAAFARRAKASRIVVNGSPIQFGEGVKTPLKEGDEVALLVPTGGG